MIFLYVRRAANQGVGSCLTICKIFLFGASNQAERYSEQPDLLFGIAVDCSVQTGASGEHDALQLYREGTGASRDIGGAGAPVGGAGGCGGPAGGCRAGSERL